MALATTKLRIFQHFRDLTRPATLLLCGLLAGTAAPTTVRSQMPGEPAEWAAITAPGVTRAAAQVDSVYVDRQLPEVVIAGGDFAAYLMARLGLRSSPPDFGFQVAIDTSLIRIGGRISDLPAEARQALSQLVLMLPASTRLEAQVDLARAGPEAVRFHLRSATVDGIGIPEMLLAPLMGSVGRQYPALTASGRDLYVQIPAGASMKLIPGAVVLTGP